MKHKRFWILASMALALGCLLAMGTWAGTNNQATPLSIVNKTNSLTVTKAELEPSGRTVRLAVKNTTDKYIDWFRISLGPTSNIEADFAYADKPFLAPDESYEDSYPISLERGNVNIVIMSVVFEDKSMDGDVRFAQKLMDKRLGQEIELRRLLPLINEAINGNEQGVARVEALENKIAESRVDSNDSSLAVAAQDGMKAARERVLSEIRSVKALESQNQDALPSLRKLAAKYDGINSKLKKYAR